MKKKERRHIFFSGGRRESLYKALNTLLRRVAEILRYTFPPFFCALYSFGLKQGDDVGALSDRRQIRSRISIRVLYCFGGISTFIIWPELRAHFDCFIGAVLE
jgi:hypothetical protein